MFLGQSNMVGQGAPSQLVDRGSEIKDLYAFDGKLWQNFREPLQNPRDNVYASSADLSGGIGPGYSFGCAMHKAGMRSVGLMLCAKSGVGLANWEPDNKLYGEMRARLKLATKQRRLKGVLIYIGESDARSKSVADAWPLSFTRLVWNIRRDMNQPSLPVVYAQLATIGLQWKSRHEHGFAGWDHLKQLQEQIRIERVSMIKTALKHKITDVAWPQIC